MERPDALLFDLDGTIVDSRVPYTRCMNYALARIGQPERPPQELHQYLGPPIHETLVEHLAVPLELVDRCIELYRERYVAVGMDETEVFSGVPELLVSLDGRIPMAVATSKVLTLAELLLQKLGLRQHFVAVAAPLPEAIDESKATTIASALTALGGPLKPVMIGDRFYDVAGALEHNIPTIAVRWGIGSEQELRDAGAAALVNSPDEIPALIGL
jgi:phosphoglycolate phosphatase